MWDIYTYGNGDVISQVMLGLRIMMTTGRFESLFHLALLGFVLFGLVYYAFNRRAPMLPLFLGAIIILYASVRITVDVSVMDQVNPDVADVVVTGVPIAVALPAYVTGQVGFFVTQLVEASFAIPVQYTQGQSTYNRPLFDFQKVLTATLTDSDLARNLDIYFMFCVFPEVDLQQKNLGTLMSAGDLLAAFAATNNALTALGYAGGTREAAPRTCPDFYNILVAPAFTGPGADYTNAMRLLRTKLQLTAASPIDEIGLTDDLRANLLPVAGQDSTQLINNVLLINRWRHAEHEDAKRKADPAESILLEQRAVRQDLKEQAFSRSNVAQKMIPMLRTIVEAMVYIMSPFILTLAISPGMMKMVSLYWKCFLWLLTWGPLYAVMNFVLFQEARSRLGGLLAAATSANVNMETYDALNEFIAMMNSTAADYAFLVPGIGWALVWGGSAIGSSFGAGAKTAEGAASSVASQFARGEGRALLEGPAYHTEPVSLPRGQVIGHGVESGPQFSIPVGAGGVRVDNQNGTADIFDSHGGVTKLGSNGTVIYHGSEGQYTRRADGSYESGVFRHSMFDSHSGQQVQVQTSVFGDMVEDRFTYTGGDGVGRSVMVQRNQNSGVISDRTEQSIHDGLRENRTISDKGYESFNQSGNLMLWRHYGDRVEADQALVTVAGFRESGMSSDQVTNATIQSTIDGKSFQSGTLEKKNGQWHFFAQQFEKEKGGKETGIAGGLQRTILGGPDHAQFFLETGNKSFMTVGPFGQSGFIAGSVLARGTVDDTDKANPKTNYSNFSVSEDRGGITHTVFGQVRKDEDGMEKLFVSHESWEQGSKGMRHGPQTIGGYTFEGTFTGLTGKANDSNVPTLFNGMVMDSKNPSAQPFQASALLKDGKVAFLSGQDGDIKTSHEKRTLPDGTQLEGTFTEVNGFGKDSSPVTLFHGKEKPLLGPERESSGLLEGSNLVNFKGGSGIHKQDIGTDITSDGHITHGMTETLSDRNGRNPVVRHDGVKVDSHSGEKTASRSTFLGSERIMEQDQRGYQKGVFDLVQEMYGHRKEGFGIDSFQGSFMVYDSNQGKEIPMYAQLFYQTGEDGKRVSDTPIGGMVRNTVDESYSSFFTTESGEQVWGIKQGAQDMKSGISAGTFQSTITAKTGEDGEVHTRELGKKIGKDGQRELLSHSVVSGFSRQHLNEDVSKGTFAVTDPKTGGSRKVNGWIARDPQTHQVMAYDVTDTGKGVIGEFRTSKEGKPVYSVREFTASPDGKGMVERTREVNEDYFVKNGYVTSNYRDQEGNVVLSEGKKGTDHHDFNRVQFHSDSGSNLSVTQMVFKAMGTDMSNPSKVEEGIAYGIESGRLGIDGLNKFLILRGRGLGQSRRGGGIEGGGTVSGGRGPSGPGNGSPSGQGPQFLSSEQNKNEWMSSYGSMLQNAAEFARMSVSSAVSAGHFAPDSPEAADYAATQAFESIKSQSKALVQGDEDISFPSMPRIREDQPSLLKSPSNGGGAPSARIRGSDRGSSQSSRPSPSRSNEPVIK